ncbi:MAG: hypothetical protein LBC19_14200 [Tannerella sp.]|nr:hypothetical protein [Tannerella sp.]
MNVKESMSRRNFLATSGAALAGSALIRPASELGATPVVSSPRQAGRKLKLAMAGTGSRGTSMWGRGLAQRYPATIKYANGVQVSYSLTAYSPYEGYRIAFNGTKGRIDAWIQESSPIQDRDFDEIILFKNFSRRQYIQIPHGVSGHGCGDNHIPLSISKSFQKNATKYCLFHNVIL